ncbi:MAG: hypothetical protein ACRCUS_01280 [Anaerovoracaceae bacterium]
MKKVTQIKKTEADRKLNPINVKKYICGKQQKSPSGDSLKDYAPICLPEATCSK